MVNSGKDETMVESEDLQTRVGRVEDKIDSLAVCVDARFDAVDAALAEQRQYTEFGYERLEHAMNGRFDGMNNRFEHLEHAMNSRFERLERKLDQFIDAHEKRKSNS